MRLSVLETNQIYTCYLHTLIVAEKSLLIQQFLPEFYSFINQ